MDYKALKQLIDNHPEWSALSDAEVAEACNTATVTRTMDSYFIRMRTLFADLGPSMAMEIKLRLQAYVNTGASEAAPVEEVLGWITSTGPGTGLDICHATTRGMIDALVAGTVLTAEQGAALKALGEETVSPAAVAGLGTVKVGHVTRARAL